MNKTGFAAAAALLAFTAVPASAQDGDRTEIGVLECLIEGGFDLSIISSDDLSCTFQPAGDGAAETYIGTVDKFGLDIGVTGDKIMEWAVLAPTEDNFAPGALEGSYVGASGEITAGIGGGANVLVGGSNETLVLQPISVQAQAGVNLALGVSKFELVSTAE